MESLPYLNHEYCMNRFTITKHIYHCLLLRSGDLVSPAKNIPRGTLCGCLTTFTVFLVLSVLTSLTCDPALLQHDCMYMVQVSCSPPPGTASSLPCRSSPSSSRWCWWAWCWPPGPPASPT